MGCRAENPEIQENGLRKVRVRLAGVTFSVSCRYGSNADFFRDYACGGEPLFEVAASREDMERVREALERQSAEEAADPCRASAVEAMDLSRVSASEATDLRCALAAEAADPGRVSGAFLENAAIHALAADRLIDYGALVMHGSALAFDGRAFIFTAPSGTGKSTHAALWRERFGSRVTMINDDKPILRFTENEIFACGSPWMGGHGLGSNIEAPLCAIALIERSSENRIEELGADEAVRVLYGQAVESKDPARMKKIMEMLARLIKEIPLYRLQCNAEPEAAAVACEAMAPLE